MNIVESIDVWVKGTQESKDDLRIFFIRDLMTHQSIVQSSSSSGPSQVNDQNSIRLLQQKALRHLLNSAGIHAQVEYLHNGKPTIANGPHISVSHTGNSIALSVYARNHGMDIEKSGMKAFKVRTRFCSAHELNWAEPLNEPDIFTVMWCVKEAVFKYFGERVDFRAEIMIHPFQPYSDLMVANYNGAHGDMVFNCSYKRSGNTHVIIAAPVE